MDQDTGIDRAPGLQIQPVQGQNPTEDWSAAHRIEDFDRTLSRFIALIGLALLVIALVDEAGRSPWPAWWRTMGFALMAVLFILIAALPHRIDFLVVRRLWLMVCSLGIVQIATTFQAGGGYTGDALWDSTWLLTGIYIPLLALAYPKRFTMLNIGLFSAVLSVLPALSYWLTYGQYDKWMIRMAFTLFSSIGYGILAFLMHRRMLDDYMIQEEWHVLTTASEVAAARLNEERDLSSLAHDQVLGMLNAAALWEGPIPMEVKAAALKALTLLKDRLAEPGNHRIEALHNSMRQTVLELDPHCEFLVVAEPGVLPSKVGTRITEALTEAVRNAIKYAPTADHWIWGSLAPEAAKVVIADNGPGFDPNTVPEDRLGISGSIYGQMEAVAGGSANVSSVPGGGTVVTLSWRPPKAAAEDTGVPDESTFGAHTQAVVGPVTLLFMALLAVPVVRLFTDDILSHPKAWIMEVSLAAFVLGSLFLLIPRDTFIPRLRETLVTFSAMTTGVIILGLGTPVYDSGLFLNAVVLCSVIILYGNSVMGLLGGCILIVSHAIATYSLIPDPPLTEALSLYSALVILAALGWLRFTKMISERQMEFHAQGLAAIATKGEHERALVRMRMNNAIAATGALQALQSLTGARDVDHALRTEMLIAESSLRDHIRCPEFDNPLLAQEILAARYRGVEVLLLGTTKNPTAEVEPIDADFAAAIAAKVVEAKSQDRITLRLLPKGSSPAVVSLSINTTDGSFVQWQWNDEGIAIHAPQF